MYTTENFYSATVAIFKKCGVPRTKPDFISYNKSGLVSSRYWYGSDGLGDYVIRYSGHWSARQCKMIKNCWWVIDVNAKCGKCYLKDFVQFSSSIIIDTMKYNKLKDYLICTKYSVYLSSKRLSNYELMNRYLSYRLEEKRFHDSIEAIRENYLNTNDTSSLYKELSALFEVETSFIDGLFLKGEKYSPKYKIGDILNKLNINKQRISQKHYYIKK